MQYISYKPYIKNRLMYTSVRFRLDPQSCINNTVTKGLTV